MAKERSVYLRVGVKDADRAIAELRRLGIDGEAALKRVGRGGPDASKALLAVDAASKSARAGVSGLASEAARAGGPLGGMAVQADRLAGAMRGGGGAGLVLAAGVTAATVAVGGSIAAFASAEKQILRTEALIKATGGAAGLTGRDIEKMAQQLGTTTLATTRNVRDAADILLTFRSIGKDVFGEVLGIAQDLSEVFGNDLRSATVQVGKALENPILGVSALAEVGVSFTAQQKEMIKTLVETGDKAGAMRVILDELKSEVGGAGVGAASGVTGAFNAAGGAAALFAENLGGILAKTPFVRDAVAGLTILFKEFNAAVAGGDGGDRVDAVRSDLSAKLDELRRRKDVLQAAENSTIPISPPRMAAYRQEVAKAAAELDGLRTKLVNLQMAEAGAARTVAARAIAAEQSRAADALAEQQGKVDAILAAGQEELRLARLSADRRTVERAVLKAIADARKEGVIDAVKLAKVEADARAVATEKLKIEQDQAAAIKAQTEAIAAAAKAEADRAARNEALDKYIAGLETEVSLAGQGGDERERSLAIIKATEAAQRTLTDEEAARVSIAVQQRQAIEHQAEAAKRASDAQQRAAEAAQEAQKRAAEQAEKDWQHTADRIVDIWGDGWAQVASNGLDSMRGFLEDTRVAAVRTMAQISAEAIIRPVLDLSGISSQANASGLTALGLGIAGASQTDRSSGLLSSGLGIARGVAGNITGVGGFTSTLGSQALNYGLSSAPQTMVDLGLGSATNVGGTLIATPTAFGSSLASGVNSAGWGTIGTFGAQALGFESRNPYVGAGLGAAGSIGGGIAGAALLGGTIGGPIGAAAGAFIAQMLSSQIGAGASVGPNESAYLGTAGGRFQIGGSGQDNGGDASQARAVVQSAADALNALIDAAGLTIANPESGFWRYGVGTPGVSPYTATNAEQLFGQVLGSGRLTSADPATAAALQHSGGSLDQILSDVKFAQNFGDAITGLKRSTLDYAGVLEVQTKQAVKDQTAQIQQFIGTVDRLGLSTADATAAAKDYVDALAGITPAQQPLTDVEARVKTITTTFAQLGPLLAQVGESADAAAAGMERQLAVVRGDLTHALQADINEARGVGVVNTISALIDQAALNRRSAVAAGVDTSLVDQWLQAQIVAQLGRADQAGVLAVLSQLGSSPVAVQAATQALAALSAGVKDLAGSAEAAIADLAGADRLLHDAMISSLTDIGDAAGQLVQQFTGYVTSLSRYRQDLLVGDLSPLSAADQLAAARSRVQGLQAGIAGGDPASYEELQNAIGSFLTASRQFNASGAGYTSDFNLAQDLLAQAEDNARKQVDLQQAAQQAALTQVDELRGIRGVLEDLSAPLIDFARLGAQVLAGQAGGPSAIDRQHALLAQMGPDELAVALGNMAVGGQGQAFARSVLGGQSFSADIEAALRDQFSTIGQQMMAGLITGEEAIRQQLALYSRADLATLQYFRSVTNPKGINAGSLTDYIDQLGGGVQPQLQGFAAGGVVDRAGAYNLAEGRYSEAVVPLPDGRSIPVTMQGGDGAGTRAMQAELRALRDQVAALTRVVAAAGDRQIEALGTVAGNTRQMATKLRIAGAQ